LSGKKRYGIPNLGREFQKNIALPKMGKGEAATEVETNKKRRQTKRPILGQGQGENPIRREKRQFSEW